MAARGRPRAFDRAAALAAATKLFWRKGFAATSVADLCEVMGIAPPSLYAAFKSKEALYAEAIAHYQSVYGPLIAEPFAAGETAQAAIEAFLMASAATLPAADQPGGCMVTLAVAGEAAGDLATTLASARAETLARIEARLTTALAEGELPPTADKGAIARFYLAVQQGMSVQARDGATRADLEAVARAAMAAWATLAQSSERSPCSIASQ